MAGVLLSMDNPLFRTFLGHASLMAFKVFAVTFLTTYYRMTKSVFTNPEDLSLSEEAKKKGVVRDDPDVERVRRIHLNDLENIVPFLILSLIYLATGPDPSLATLHFRIFTISRFTHTICYFFLIPQPSRFLSFLVGMAINLSLTYQIFRQAAF